MRCEIPHRCVRRKYRIRRHSPFRLRNCWEGRSVRASSLLRQLAKGGCAARRLSWVTPGFSQSRRCKTTASAKLACLQRTSIVVTDPTIKTLEQIAKLTNSTLVVDLIPNEPTEPESEQVTLDLEMEEEKSNDFV